MIGPPVAHPRLFVNGQVESEEHIGRARHWLETHSPESTEDSAFRLFGGRSAGVSAPVLQAWAARSVERRFLRHGGLA